MQTRKRAIVAVCATGLVAFAGTGLWWQAHNEEIKQQRAARKQLAYQPDGFGGFSKRAATVPSPSATPLAPTNKAARPSSADTIPLALTTARAAYAKGNYKAAEAAAKQVIASAPKQGRATVATVAVASAEHLIAFTAARQGDLKTARIRFAEARKDAQTLPAASPAPAAIGEMPSPTLVQDAAYQHAVCTMALGDKTGAEREFVQFLRDFPDSPLVHGSMRRIARMHGGNIPKDVEAVWRQSMTIAQQRDKERQRDASLCGPECLAELLKRRGAALPVEKLAQEMKTDASGSSLTALQTALQNHGFSEARGVRLTAKGLTEQQFPVIALVQPGHFVVVDKVSTDGSVTFWDKGNGDATIRILPATEWQQVWQGIAVTTVQPAGTRSSAGTATRTAVAVSEITDNTADKTTTQKSGTSGTSGKTQ